MRSVLNVLKDGFGNKIKKYFKKFTIHNRLVHEPITVDLSYNVMKRIKYFVIIKKALFYLRSVIL
jgi:hypothetical protein